MSSIGPAALGRPVAGRVGRSHSPSVVRLRPQHTWTRPLPGRRRDRAAVDHGQVRPPPTAYCLLKIRPGCPRGGYPNPLTFAPLFMEIFMEPDRLPPVTPLPCAKFLPAMQLSRERLPVLCIRRIGVSPPRPQQVVICVRVHRDLRKQIDGK